MSDGLVIVVHLPQPIGKVTDLLNVLGKNWPHAMLNVKPEPPASDLGNWLIELSPET